MAEDYNSIGFKNKDIDRLRQIQQDTIKPRVNPAELAKQKRAELEKKAKAKREEIVRKKDSIAQRGADAKGMTLEEYRSWNTKNNKKCDAGLDNMGSGTDNKKSDCKAASKGDSTKKIR
jgi:hypothetical protein